MAALPVGSLVTGTVIGRQPFGVFVAIDQAVDAIGLAETTSMPPGAELPAMGNTVTGEVVWHNDRNYQVRLKLV